MTNNNPFPHGLYVLLDAESDEPACYNGGYALQHDGNTLCDGLTLEQAEYIQNAVNAAGRAGGFKTGPFTIKTNDDDEERTHQYLYVEMEKGGEIQIKLDDEGVIVDIFDKAQWNSLATCAVTYEEINNDEKV